jgi:hypothetical protein
MVTCNGYRNPALPAKIASTTDCGLCCKRNFVVAPERSHTIEIEAEGDLAIALRLFVPGLIKSSFGNGITKYLI